MATNQVAAIQRAISQYGANSREAREAYNDYERSMRDAKQEPKSRQHFGVK